MAGDDSLRTQILDTAEAMVRELGMRGLSMRKIAARIGYSVATLYTQFRNQDDLILQLNSRTLYQLHAELAEAAHSHPQAEARLLAMAHAYADFAHQHPNRFLMAFEHRLPAGQPVPDWLRKQVDALLYLAADLIGPLRPGADEAAARGLAAGLWAAVHGLTLLSLTGKLNFSIVDAAPRTALMGDLVIHYLRGVRSDEIDA